MMETELVTQYGLAGAGLLMMYRIAATHIQANTEATEEMSAELTELRKVLLSGWARTDGGGLEDGESDSPE